MRVIRFVDGGGSRREAAEQFDVSVSSAIRWMQRFRDDGTSEPMPRGGSISPLEKYAERILALIREQPDLTLDEMVLAPQKRRTSASRSALSRFFARHGITVRALLTDNGSSYRSHQFRQACFELGLKHRRTRPYSPQTNGKAERFIQTALREWAYSTHWPDSVQRNLCLAPWTDYYNFTRPHGSLHYQPPISRSDPGTTS